MRCDTDFRRDVEAELQWDPSIDDRKIGIIANDDIVTLTGEVTHLTGRWAAEEIAKRAAANALRWNVGTATSSTTPIVNEGCVKQHIEEALKRLALRRLQVRQ
jgi:hypothetical protein